MCTIVHQTVKPIVRPYRRVTVEPHDLFIVTIPAGLSYASSLALVRMILAELGIPQPRDGASCFCGAPVRVFGVPVQRHTSEGAYVAS
jgi:hypothetical protein